MMAASSPTEYTIIHLPPGSDDWGGVLAQFSLALLEQEGRHFAAWAGDRLARATRSSEGVVAFAGGTLMGLVLVEIVDHSAEITFPWMREQDTALADHLIAATLQAIREGHHDVRHIRAERQSLPGQADMTVMQSAGFFCCWRRRMQLDLPGWEAQGEAPPGYRLVPWDIRFLDQAATVVYQANLGTLDAILYAPFFGESPAQCRTGLLSILAGRYGPLHPRATTCALQGDTLVGINLILSSGADWTSVVEISVDPTHQRRGIGRALMVQSVKMLQYERVERVELAVTRDNTHAAALYESLGFTDIGDFPVCVWPPR
jgi:ribosomal protein S18 acetylase RimI-like enzyme